MDIKTISYLIHDTVLNPELSSQEHGIDGMTNPAQILAGVTGGLSLHSLWAERLKKNQKNNHKHLKAQREHSQKLYWGEKETWRQSSEQLLQNKVKN